jgi:hypothetical protein
MARRREQEVQAHGPYIIESQPSTKPPQPNGQESSEAVHWYYASPGWVTSKKNATVFKQASAAVAEIAALRRLVDGVQFTLVPVDGSIMYKPI